MNNQVVSIKKIVSYLNDEQENGGFWLPNIQRNFIWKAEQIEKLFDSLMRDYPIGTLLVWKTKDKIKSRKFIDNYTDKTNFIELYISENDWKKNLVLDGQQRLQSFFIGLCGSYNGKELYFDILSGNSKPPSDLRFNFKFLGNSKEEKWVKVKDIIHDFDHKKKSKQEIRKEFQNFFSEQKDKDIIENNLDILFKALVDDNRIVYQEFDSIEQPQLYQEDDVVEIFIRANSGGTPLGKSDLLFSLLTANWEEVEENMGSLVYELNKTDYKFTKDFVLKTCLTLLDTGAKYEVNKFRKPEVIQKLTENWNDIKDAFLAVRNFLHGKTFLRSSKSIKSYLSLIPVIYFRYHYKKELDTIKNLDHYFTRTLLAGVFSGNPDRLIDNCIKVIRENEKFETKKIFREVKINSRSLEISKNDLLQQYYGKKNNNLHVIFSLWYPNVDYNPSYSGNELQIDHIFPQNTLRKIKQSEHNLSPKLKYSLDDRNQIANLMLLTKEENGPGGKGDIEPSEWFKNKDPKYFKIHLVPEDPKLWEIDNFEKFIEERKKLICDKFKNILIKEQRGWYPK